MPKLLTLAQSNDINPIENLWVYVKKKVRKKSPTSKNELKGLIKEEGGKYLQNMKPEAYSIYEKISVNGNRACILS